MVRSLNLINKRFGKLQVIGREESNKHGSSMWKCLCDCGKESIVVGARLTSGKTKSCGCLSIDSIRSRSTKHGQASRSGKSREYNAWREMKRRCYTKTCKSYALYGGKGVRVSEEWVNSFENFYKDMGNCPSTYELDRINNSKGYSKENCRWASEIEQARNREYCMLDEEKATAIRLDSRTASKIAQDYGVSKSTIIRVKANKAWRVLE